MTKRGTNFDNPKVHFPNPTVAFFQLAALSVVASQECKAPGIALEAFQDEKLDYGATEHSKKASKVG